MQCYTGHLPNKTFMQLLISGSLGLKLLKGTFVGPSVTVHRDYVPLFAKVESGGCVAHRTAQKSLHYDVHASLLGERFLFKGVMRYGKYHCIILVKFDGKVRSVSVIKCLQSSGKDEFSLTECLYSILQLHSFFSVISFISFHFLSREKHRQRSDRLA